MKLSVSAALAAAALTTAGGQALARRPVVSPSITPITRETPWIARSDARQKAADAIVMVNFGEIRFQSQTAFVQEGRDRARQTFRTGGAVHAPGTITAACLPGVPSAWDEWLRASNAQPPGKREFATLVLTKTAGARTPDLFSRRVRANIAPLSVQRAEEKEKGTCVEKIVFAVESMSIEGANGPGPNPYPLSVGGVAVELQACADCEETTLDYGFLVVAGGGRTVVRDTLTFGADQDFQLSPFAEYETVQPLWLRGLATYERTTLLEWVNEALSGAATPRSLHVAELQYDEETGQVRAARAQSYEGALPTRLFLQSIPIDAALTECGAHCAELEYLEVQPASMSRDNRRDD